jgi:hypothetical protein
LRRDSNPSPISIRLIYFTFLSKLVALWLCTAGLSNLLDAAAIENRSGLLKLDVVKTESGSTETVSLKKAGIWVPVLSASDAETHVTAFEIAANPKHCKTTSVSLEVGSRIVIISDCESGILTRSLFFTPAPDALEVHAIFKRRENARILSVEDRYGFLPARHPTDTPLAGPLDFVWSQGIKESEGDVVSSFQFKSPVVMFQQGETFAAVVPTLEKGAAVPLALDLNVTSSERAWFSCGLVATKPYGHSYFRRADVGGLPEASGVLEYSYLIFASIQPPRLGYRRMVRYLWDNVGHGQLIESPDLQENTKRPEVELFDEWRQDAWTRYADEVYKGFPCGGERCGTLSSNRNPWGHWDNPAPDAWFNSWFQTLRTAYGWYFYGRQTQNADIQRKAETVLTLALKSPRQEGAFSTIYLLNDDKWIRDDGWAGFSEDYHAFCMSWTAYWMLQWAKDLTPPRRDEILAFVKPYGDFLVKHQLGSGVIPSWYDGDLNPRSEFGEFNAETAGSALLLLELNQQTGNKIYLSAAVRAMDFVTQQVLPRQRWFDFETFKSCARKSFNFYDPWTAQYPQNNLSTIQAAKAYLKLSQITGDSHYLELGLEVLDYLLLTQQVWNNPAFSPKLVGGFTTQNTDSEWSDARQCYAADLLWDYYKETGKQEYLERAVAAARSTFAVAPWENWAHTGYEDVHGALTGFHWGTGSAMTSVEMMWPALGDVLIDIARAQGVGFNACSLKQLSVTGSSIRFTLDAPARMHTINVKFAGVDTHRRYEVSWNGGKPVVMNGIDLIKAGFVIQR